MIALWFSSSQRARDSTTAFFASGLPASFCLAQKRRELTGFKKQSRRIDATPGVPGKTSHRAFRRVDREECSKSHRNETIA